MSICEEFVKALCKAKKLSYRAMVIKYPQAYERERVYIDGERTTDKEHCTHCARAEAINQFEAKQ